MRLCFIGNSHIAAFRLGWDETDYPRRGIRSEFFGARANGLKDLRAEGRALVAQNPVVVEQLAFTSGGKTAIEVEAYDGFVVVGLGVGLSSMISIGEQHRTVATLAGSGAPHLISDALLDLTVRRSVEGSVSLQIARMIRSIAPDARIVLACAPNPCPGIAGASEPHWRDFDTLGRRIAPVWELVRRDTAQSAGLFIEDQPPETVESQIYTRPEFGQGSVRLKKGFAEQHEADEFRHMNPRYGAAFITHIIPRLAAPDGAEAASAAERSPDSPQLPARPLPV